MKTAKKALSFFLCALMLATSLINDGWNSLIPPPEASAMAGHEQKYNDTRIELDFNKNWSFGFTDDEAAYLKGFDDSEWEKVDLPHDFSMSQEFTTKGTEAESGNLPGGSGWYRKWFNLYEYYSGDRVILNFDGAYQHVYVYVNGKYVGENHYGYNSFSFEIADYLICSNTVLNLIAVKVVNELPSSRWYSGSGLNRDVSLTIAGPVHVSLYGPRITTPKIEDGDGTAEATIKLHNCTPISKKVSVEATVLDSNHNKVSETVVQKDISISGNAETYVTLSPKVNNPKLWTLDDPQLYKLQTIVRNEAGELIDEYHTTFGYRDINWDTDKGFSLNGEYIKLKGVCLHHDQGALGAAQEYEAIYRQLVTLKEMGCNAIRTSHNSTSKIVINICNEIGMLVIEEFFDGWDASKNGNTNDFSKYFNETIDSSNKAIGAKGQKWYQYVIEHTILRDEHDPCVIAWDIGNELSGISGGESTENYAEIVQSINRIIETLDTSHVVLQGNNAPNNPVNTMIDGYMDVIGGNYNLNEWVTIMNGSTDSRTNKPFVATESASAVSSRGVYYTMRKDETNKQISAYDTNWVDWGNSAAEAWHAVVTNDWFSGEFIWTGFDYIGEPTPWNDPDGSKYGVTPNSSYFGVVDTAGFEKDSYYLYRSLWNEKDTTLHLVPGSWNSNKLDLDNGYVNVAVYSNAAEIRLFLNGTHIATAKSRVITTPAGYTYKTWNETVVDSSRCSATQFYNGNGSDFYPQFKVKYATGSLSVKAYDANGNEITNTSGSTASFSGTATQIAANTWQDRNTYVADSTDYIYVEYEARDADGNFMNDYNGTLNIKVDDSSARYATIVGVDNGNPATTEKYQQPSVILSDSEAKIQMFNGRALVILKTTEEEGTINITGIATENGTSFSTQGVTVTSVTESGIHLTDELDEVVTQNKTPYQVTLYDEFEIVKYHINQLEEPVAGGGSDSEDTTDSNKFEIYLPDASSTIADGKYAITYNPFASDVYVLKGSPLYNYTMDKELVSSDTEDAPSGSSYVYESFQTASSNIYTITHQGNNQYYIYNESAKKYLYWDNNGSTSLSDYMILYTIEVKDNGSVRISNGSFYLGGDGFGGMSGITTKLSEVNYRLWLYSAPGESSSEPSEPSEPSLPNVNAPYQIFLADKNSTQYIPDGDYIIFNQNYVMTNNQWGNWGMSGSNSLNDTISAPTGSAYTYESFNTELENVYSFIHQGNNTYFVQNKNTKKYVYFSDQVQYLSYSDTPKAVSVYANNDGSLLIYSGNYFLYHSGYYTYFYSNGTNIESAGKNKNNIFWLYTKPTQATPPATIKYSHYTPTNDYNVPIVDGEYVLLNNNNVLSAERYNYDGMHVDSVSDIKNADSGSAYNYERFTTDDSNVYILTSQGNGQYYIQNKSTGNYLFMDNVGKLYYFTGWQSLFHITINANGSAYIRSGNYFISNTSDANVSSYLSGSQTADSNAEFWFYSLDTSEDSESGDNESGGEVATTAKVALYDALHDGIAEDFSLYTRASFETLLRALENGVEVFKAKSSTDADYTAATKAIKDAIAALEIDIKQIKGTLFKYGYNNSTGTSDYSDGGLLMNDISVEQMKTAILANINLVNQIKDIIDYDGVNTNWEAGYADRAIEEIAEAYARIYSLQFTGKPLANTAFDNKAEITPDLSTSQKIPVTLWNVWTKENTRGESESKPEGASIQGLASSTLERNVIKSHAAYQNSLSYANDGDSTPNDIRKYTYTFNTSASTTKNVTLEYLSGLSVYFPDLFTRENLDTQGNATTATKGQFAKYYWDAAFPIFINTDEYGVNTYHFDSADTDYIVQSKFDDDTQTVDMKLTEVNSWAISGPNGNPVTGKSTGFFPFNYKQGTTSYTGEQAIYHYGFSFDHNFYIPKGGKHLNGEDVIFNFSGDDDVYVYIDGVLVLDNGGLHGAREVTINFTECTINYQFAMDVTNGKLKGGEYELTYSYNEYFENPDTCGYNADTIAALNKLHSVISDGQVHTLNFFYLERGSTDSNCRMSFNLSETSEEVRIIDQELTLDYGLPVEYNIQDNNNLSQAALDNNVKVEYLGLCAVNEEVETTYTFELPEIKVPFEEGKTYTVEGMKYGECTIDKEGNTKYVLKCMNMSESEHFYVCAKITGDPTYAEAVTYYQIERTTFIPASTIYYEDTYESVSYTDGKVPSNYNNDVNKYGLWQEYGEQLTTLKQSADLTDSEANPYGFETNYTSFAEYSGGSIHYVDVSTKNNPNQKYSGGEGAQWPTVEFTFTGTGFDLISITDNTTGAFSVTVRDSVTNTIVRNTVVDTFYGYNYGRIYADADGKPTLDDTLTPMYRSENGTCTSSERYYDEKGEITEVPHYYDENDNVLKTETAKPAYAYAYGWIVAEDGTTEKLYQIPVIKITDLEYGNYNVTITPTFTSIFGHSSVNTDGTSYYRVYLDAIKIYSPAGVGDDIADKLVKDAYATDDELYPDYLELKNMLIGAESLSETEEQGIIFIDGIAALDNDLEKYKNAGPNNELYLAKDQAVAFEIWATSVPTDIQLGTKLACGEPQLTISYDANLTSLDIKTAHDTFYSLNTVLPNSAKLTWHLITGADGNKYYTTGTVVIQNTGEKDSVLSVTNLKWTFSQNGGKGYFRIPTSVENEVVSVAATENTPMLAYSLMRMRTADLNIEQTEEPEIVTSEDGSSIVTIKLTTSSDVDSLVITDNNGNIITPEEIEHFAAELDGREVTEWIVTLSEDKPGIYTYTVAGAYENGYVDYSEAMTVTVTVENPPTVENPEDDQPKDETPDEESVNSLFDTLIGFFNRIIEFFRALFALFGVDF